MNNVNEIYFPCCNEAACLEHCPSCGRPGIVTSWRPGVRVVVLGAENEILAGQQGTVLTVAERVHSDELVTLVVQLDDEPFERWVPENRLATITDEPCCARHASCTCDFINDEFPCEFCSAKLDAPLWKTPRLIAQSDGGDQFYPIDAILLPSWQVKKWAPTWQQTVAWLHDGCN